MKVIEKEVVHFRILLYDLQATETGMKARTISLSNHDKMTIDDLKKIVVDCLNGKCKV